MKKITEEDCLQNKLDIRDLILELAGTEQRAAVQHKQENLVHLSN